MPRGRPRATSGGMQNAVISLKAAHSALLAERATIEKRISAIAGALDAMGSAAPAAARGPGKRGRPAGAGGKAAFRRGSLKEYIHRAMSGGSGEMAVKDVTAAVMKLGFKTKNKTLAKSVGIALTQMPMVEKVGRGSFRIG